VEKIPLLRIARYYNIRIIPKYPASDSLLWVKTTDLGLKLHNPGKIRRRMDVSLSLLPKMIGCRLKIAA